MWQNQCILTPKGASLFPGSLPGIGLCEPGHLLDYFIQPALLLRQSGCGPSEKGEAQCIWFSPLGMRKEQPRAPLLFGADNGYGILLPMGCMRTLVQENTGDSIGMLPPFFAGYDSPILKKHPCIWARKGGSCGISLNCILLRTCQVLKIREPTNKVCVNSRVLFFTLVSSGHGSKARTLGEYPNPH